jgi:hypothetical protein
MWKEALWSTDEISRHFPEMAEENHETLSEDSWSSGRGLNWTFQIRSRTDAIRSLY